MTTPAQSLPQDGASDWGDTLNSYITNVIVDNMSTTAQNLANHEANDPADPHGDRAYALQLVLPITQNADKPGGFVELNSAGMIPSQFLPPEDTWHDLRPYNRPFQEAYGFLPPQYRQVNGGVQIAGYVQITSRDYFGSPLFANALPSSVWPPSQVDLPVAVSQWFLNPAVITVSRDGYITLNQIPVRLPPGTEVSLSCWYPLDNYGLITS